MKKSLLVLLLSSVCAFAQSNVLTVPNAVPVISLNELGVLTTNKTPILTTNALAVANDVLTWIEPLVPYLTNKQVILEVAPLYGISDHRVGFFADLQIPINSTLSLGCGEALADGQWFTTLISAKVGAPFTIPVINRPCFAYAQTGASVLDSTANFGNLSIAGAFTQFDLSKTIKLNLEGGVLKFSQLAGEHPYVGASLNWKW